MANKNEESRERRGLNLLRPNAHRIGDQSRQPRGGVLSGTRPQETLATLLHYVAYVEASFKSEEFAGAGDR